MRFEEPSNRAWILILELCPNNWAHFHIGLRKELVRDQSPRRAGNQILSWKRTCAPGDENALIFSQGLERGDRQERYFRDSLKRGGERGDDLLKMKKGFFRSLLCKRDRIAL